LQLRPDSLVPARLCEALPKEPDRGGVRDLLGVAEEPAETDPVRGLALQLWV
jgi:hypothetical protein